MLKGDHRRGDVPFGGSPAQCVPVHFHHVVPAEHGVAFSPALWETSPSLFLFFPFSPLRVFVCVSVCEMLSCYVVPSFQRRKLPIRGPPAWIGHRAAVWPARMNATPNFSTRVPPMQPLKHVCWTASGCHQEGGRGGHFLHFLSYFSPFLSLVFVSLSPF